MEPHVKERIVGAAVLVALGVWLIPWILDGPDDVVTDSEALTEFSLPAAEPITPLRSETVAPDLPVSNAVEDPPESQPEPVAAVSDAATSSPASEAQSSSPSADLPSAGAGAEPEASEPTPAALAAAAEPPPDRGGWSVQLGAFGEKANADQLARRVSTYGYDAFVSEFRSNGAAMYRVRVGGFASENQADAAAGSISAHSIPARVIPPE